MNFGTANHRCRLVLRSSARRDSYLGWSSTSHGEQQHCLTLWLELSGGVRCAHALQMGVGGECHTGQHGCEGDGKRVMEME